VARKLTRREKRYRELREHHFTPLEARALSLLPRINPARTAMIRARDARWERFLKIAEGKVARGLWRRSQLPEKWARNLARYYSRMGWRVKCGPTGGQPKMPKGAVNPWAMYRWFEKQFGGPKGKPYVSPWERRQIAKGKTTLQKGLVFVQRLEKQVGRAGGVSRAMIEQWIEQKKEAIEKARGKRRAQLRIEQHRLERLL